MHLACIIPTLDEERTLPATLRSLEPNARHLSEEGGRLSIVVTDGGSTDQTLVGLQQITGLPIHIVQGPAGRGSQIRKGVERALELRADSLVVVHADTLVPAEFTEALSNALNLGAVGGGCLIRFEPAAGLLRWAAPLVNSRTRWFKVPLGDQLQWFTADAWRALGGMRPWPILEDLDWILRLRGHGSLAILPVSAVTDSRRFRERGPVRTVVRNWTIWILFLLGVSPAKLQRLYRRVR